MLLPPGIPTPTPPGSRSPLTETPQSPRPAVCQGAGFPAATGMPMNGRDARLRPDSGALCQSTDAPAVPTCPRRAWAASKFSHWSSHGSNPAEGLDTSREVRPRCASGQCPFKD